MKLLRLNKVPILEQLRLEEALLRVGEGNWCLINQGSSPAVVMGISGKVEELLHVGRVEALDLPVIKRFSGGGTVVVDESTLFVTFIGEGRRFPEALMRWSIDFFPFDLCENDYVIGDRKVGGNAQYLRKGRWLHHTSLLWDYCPERMSCLQLPTRRPNYRKSRAHEDFVGRLKEHFPSPDAFLREVQARLDDKFQLEEVSLSEVEGLLEVPHRRATKMVPR